VEFIEARAFARRRRVHFSEAEYERLQTHLTDQPDAGKVVPGSGGVRKLRWAGLGRGKRGGLRVIYYWQSMKGQIWLLMLYAKNEMADAPSHILRQMREEFERDQP
jgi:hypothetical protein